jgi:hypothetical protein
MIPFCTLIGLDREFVHYVVILFLEVVSAESYVSLQPRLCWDASRNALTSHHKAVEIHVWDSVFVSGISGFNPGTLAAVQHSYEGILKAC